MEKQGYLMSKLKPKLMQVGWEKMTQYLGWDGHVGLDQMDWMFDKNVNDELTFKG